MLRTRLALAAGALLVVGACVLPCGPLADEMGASFPYQDPTPEMLLRQAAEIAEARRVLVTRLWIAAGVAVVGLALLLYGIWRWRRRPRPY
ncbi:hypothetical protein [Plantactinospora sp. B5E13]|uniref:hypothetical protein n=1 Tax=unclassified Plantactinospora TaxID=2631981 RepID=UPI00325E6358